MTFFNSFATIFFYSKTTSVVIFSLVSAVFSSFSVVLFFLHNAVLKTLWGYVPLYIICSLFLTHIYVYVYVFSSELTKKKVL